MRQTHFVMIGDGEKRVWDLATSFLQQSLPISNKMVFSKQFCGFLRHKIPQTVLSPTIMWVTDMELVIPIIKIITIVIFSFIIIATAASAAAYYDYYYSSYLLLLLGLLLSMLSGISATCRSGNLLK